MLREISKLSRNNAIRLLACLLALLMLTACGETRQPVQQGSTPPTPGELAGSELGVSAAADDVFSLNSDLDGSFNPYVTGSAHNWLVSQLVYENIYELDDDFALSSRVVTSASSTNGSYWIFDIATGIKMHDGAELNASDVAYSIQLARNSSRYGARLANIWGASATSDTTVAVSLGRADMQLPMLLNIPIVKNGAGREARPIGSGPYRFVEGANYLEAFSKYRNASKLPFERVYLKEYTDIEETITAFEDSYIDLVLNDPTGKSNLGYGGNTERRFITTTNMHYFGFKMDGDITKYQAIRYALSMAVDRDYAASSLMGGAARAAALPISPKSPLYNPDVATLSRYDMNAVGLALFNANARDYDADGKLELVEASLMAEIELDLIVCSEAAGKGDICKRFADGLGELGFTVKVRELSWNDYKLALQEGEFDMYYAEVKLGANFDLTSLFSENGSLNYGGIEDEMYVTLINQYLAAGELERQKACDDLMTYILQNAPIIPVCFERQEVITHRNVISGMTPNSGNVFANITGWTINTEEESEA